MHKPFEINNDDVIVILCALDDMAENDEYPEKLRDMAHDLFARVGCYVISEKIKRAEMGV